MIYRIDLKIIESFLRIVDLNHYFLYIIRSILIPINIFLLILLLILFNFYDSLKKKTNETYHLKREFQSKFDVALRSSYIVILSQRTNDENSFRAGKIGQFETFVKRFTIRVYFPRSKEIEVEQRNAKHLPRNRRNRSVATLHIRRVDMGSRSSDRTHRRSRAGAESCREYRPSSPTDWIMSVPLVSPWWWRVRL